MSAAGAREWRGRSSADPEGAPRPSTDAERAPRRSVGPERAPGPSADPERAPRRSSDPEHAPRRSVDPERAWLLLWDIDGTLLRDASGAHALAILRALESVHGIDPRPGLGVATAGMTDAAIARAILREVGIEDDVIDARADAVVEHAVAVLDVPDLRHAVIEGVAGVLAELAARGDVVHGLVTGNHEPIAWAKLAAAGLDGHFAVDARGGFGSDHEDRDRLPGLARARAGAALRSDGAPWPRERTIVIGDTVRDIRCARHDGLAVVAVRTGPEPDADLSGADVVVDDAAALRAALLARIGG